MSLTIVPSIDLRGGRVVRLKQGDYQQQLNYDVEPLDVARSFRDAGAEWIHIVDLDGAKEGRPVQTDLIIKIARECDLKVQCGGGIRDPHDIEFLIAHLVRRVVIGTKALEDWGWFTDLMKSPTMAGKVVLALDARDGIVATRGWTASSGRLATDIAREVADWPLGGILYTDVSRDGMLEGPNIEHTRRIAELAKRNAVMASGGVGHLDHIKRLAANSPPIWGVIVGRSLYEGTLDLAEAIRVAATAENVR